MNPSDQIRDSYQIQADGKYAQRVAAVNSAAIFTKAYDYVVATYPNTTTEVYKSYFGGPPTGGKLQETITVVYTDDTKQFITSITRVEG